MTTLTLTPITTSALPDFPSVTTVLDSFTRANQAPVTGWTDFTGIGGDPPGPVSGLQLISNQLAPTVAGGAADGAYFNTAASGPDVECYITIATLPNDIGATVLYARLDPAAGGPVGNHYAVGHIRLDGIDDRVTIGRHDASVAIELAQYAVPSLANGDALGMRCAGTTIEAWVRISGVWSQAGSLTDSTYSGLSPGNKFGLTHREPGVTPSARWDNFIGGVAVGVFAPVSSTNLGVSAPASSTNLTLTPF